MSEAFNKYRLDLLSFHGVKCWEKHEDSFKHFLRAGELTKWMDMHPEIFGNAVKLSRKKYPKMNHKVSNIKTLFLLRWMAWSTSINYSNWGYYNG